MYNLFIAYYGFFQVNSDIPCKKTRQDAKMKVVDSGVCNFAPGGQENELAKDPCYQVNHSSEFITSTPYTLKSKIRKRDKLRN